MTGRQEEEPRQRSGLAAPTDQFLSIDGECPTGLVLEQQLPLGGVAAEMQHGRRD